MDENGSNNRGTILESDIKREQQEFLNAIQNKEALRAVHDIVENLTTIRREIPRTLFDPRRDINDECGFPQTSEITDEMYRELYDREPVATRVVEILPDECWKVQPTIFETDNPEEDTEFEQAWRELAKTIGREESWYEGEKSNPIWELLRRADIMSGIGSYGVILLGLDDGRELYEPAEPREGQQLIFASVYDKSLVEVSEWEADKGNKRYGWPTTYEIKFNDPRENSGDSVQRPGDIETNRVHWTRVVHIADGIRSNEIIGTPRQRPVFNNIYNLRKLYGGSAEMYWKGAFPGYSLKADKDIALAGLLPTPSEIRSEMEKIMNGLQRYMGMAGLTMESLAPQVVDPTPQINTQIEAICIKLNCPKRKFVGSERGELASGQDESDWNDTIAGRQNGYVTPRIIVKFHNRLIALGVLPIPKSYGVKWPDITKIEAEKKADVAVKLTDAMVKYVSGGVEALIAPIDFLTEIIGLTEEEAIGIMENVEEALEEQESQTVEDGQQPTEQVQQGQPVPTGQVGNVFCPTGEGGGIDPTCSQSGGHVPALYSMQYSEDIENELVNENTERLRDHHRQAIMAYTEWASGDMNRTLRKQDVDGLSDEQIEVFDSLSGSMSARVPDGLVVYRGIGGPHVNSIVENARNAKEVRIDGFISTSINPVVANRFTRGSEGNSAIMRIKPRRGVYVDGVSNIPDEKEFIMDHRSEFKVLGVGSIKTSSGTVPLIDLEEI